MTWVVSHQVLSCRREVSREDECVSTHAEDGPHRRSLSPKCQRSWLGVTSCLNGFSLWYHWWSQPKFHVHITINNPFMMLFIFWCFTLLIVIQCVGHSSPALMILNSLTPHNRRGHSKGQSSQAQAGVDLNHLAGSLAWDVFYLTSTLYGKDGGRAGSQYI